MQAVEFESIINDGIIRIPDEIKNQVGRQVKVILLSKDTAKFQKKAKTFSAISITTKGFVFDRNEANAR
ncbi:MAG: hypothetical protein FWG13_03545 [Leptospirales bacterium]|nr:hypothetical protein [Leptospirales bacterium]